MIIHSARYIKNDGYPLLELVIDNRVARIGRDVKQSIVERGYIPLGPAFENLLPVVTLPAEGDRSEVTLRGFTDSAQVIDLYTKFSSDVANGRFSERTLPLPS